MDLPLVQSQQASDQSLFSQKTEATIESSSVNSQADTMPIEETTQELPHSSKDSECSSNRTVAEGVEVIPETEEFLSAREDNAKETNCQSVPTHSVACPVVQDNIIQENSSSNCSEPGDKECSDEAPSTDLLTAQAQGDASDHNKCESYIGDDRPVSQGSDSGCEKSNRLLDSDDDATSNSKLHATEHSPEKENELSSSRIRHIFDSSDEDEDVAKGSLPGLKELEETKHSSDKEGELSHSHVRRIFDSSDEEDDGVAKDSDPVGDDESGNDLEGSASTHSTHNKGRGERKSAKKAMEELREIYSTSQRMTRERRMSLPYHEPEKLSLKAFLQQRRSGESQSSSLCKKEEKAAVSPEERSSTDPLLDDMESSFTGPTDPKPAEPPTASTASPEKQPAGNSAQQGSDEKLEAPLFSSRRRRTLEALAAGTVPCLSKEPVILLDDDSDRPEGVDHLLKRLAKHSKMEDSKKKKETIKAAAIVVPGIIEEGPVPEKRVSQLTLLKEKLLSKVRQQRNRSREQRYLQRCLDNEELPPDGTVHLGDDAPKSPLALADELDEEENDFSDAHDTSSDDEEEEDEGGNSSDDEVVLKHKKRAKKVNPLSDDEDEDGVKTKSPFGKKVLDEEEEDSDGELHLEMPPFLDAEDNIDEPAIGDENGVESFVDSPLPANRERTAETPLNRKYGVMRGYQSDEMELFSPLTGLPRTQSKTDTPKQGNASASSSFQESPLTSTVSRAPTLTFSPLAGSSGALTACRSLRRQFSEDFAKPWEGGTPAPTNQSQDMEELVGLCSGSFAARTQAQEPEEIEDDDDDNELLKASQDELAEDEAESGGEDEVPATSKEEPAPRLQDFLEEEAELSGSDVGSDGEEDEDEEGVLADLIAAENEKEDTDQIREEIGRFHFKQLLDEDKRELKIYQELLLEDGDLHTDGAGRQRQFRWRNSGAIDDGNLQPGSDGEEDAQQETEQEADATWRLQRLERRRWLQEQETSQRPDTPSSGSFSEQDSLLKAPTVIAKQDLRFSKKVATNKGAMCGSFLRLNSGVLGRIAERIKVTAPTETEGSVTTKNFVFRAAEQKPQKKRLSTTQPSQESKKAKLREVSEQREVAISVFEFM